MIGYVPVYWHKDLMRYDRIADKSFDTLVEAQEYIGRCLKQYPGNIVPNFFEKEEPFEIYQWCKTVGSSVFFQEAITIIKFELE